jgi:DNA-binding CsgD family transcriptional regulator/tetratricopeptide (TPR) repeat protein
VLEGLPFETHPCLLIHCAREANDIDRLVDLAPRSARYAAAAGSHRQAVDDFRELAPHLDRFDPDARGLILDEWAREEFLVDNIDEAISLNELALSHYREVGDRSAESRSLAQAAHFYENAGQRARAEQLALEAVDVLGADPDGSDLARALEVNAYLQTMAGNVTVVPELVDRTLKAGGSDIDQKILIRTLNHKGIVANIANYPDGRSSLDEAWKRAEAAGEWYEESRALFNHAWAATEFRDLPIASDYVQRAIASAVRHELPTLEAYAKAMYARVLELEGNWTKAEDLATDALNSMALSQMVALPILGGIAARRGRNTARSTLTQAWEMAVVADENQRRVPAAMALAEYAWISDDTDVPVSDFIRVMNAELDKGFQWSPGSIAFWLWKLGELSESPKGIAEPYRLVIEGEPLAAAAMWLEIGCPYERAIALAHGDQTAQLEAVELLETLRATAVSARLRRSLRDQGVFVPRGKGQTTRDHVAGLTARQAEVLHLLDECLTNADIADRLFVSPRTVEHHVSSVMAKLGSSTREEAVTRARTQGLLAVKNA